MSVYETSITNPKKQVEFYKDLSEQLESENKELKKQLKIKQDGFMASVEESCELAEENQKYKEVIDKSIKCIDYNNRYRNDADIYQFVDIKGEILEPLKDILEQNEENSNIYLKEFNDWLKEVE